MEDNRGFLSKGTDYRLLTLTTWPKAVLFDLDGTLLDNSAVVVEAYYTGMKKLGYEPKDKKFIKTLLGRSTYNTGRGLGLKEEDLPAIDTHFWDFFGSYANTLKGSPVVYESIPEILKLFHERNIPMGICTSNQASSARILIQKAGLSSYISAYVGSEDLPERKPDPQPLQLLLSKLEIPIPKNRNENLWFVGDTAPDVLAARNAGLKSIAVPDKVNLDSVKETNPDLLLDSMTQFFGLLRTI